MLLCQIIQQYPTYVTTPHSTKPMPFIDYSGCTLANLFVARHGEARGRTLLPYPYVTMEKKQENPDFMQSMCTGDCGETGIRINPALRRMYVFIFVPSSYLFFIICLSVLPISLSHPRSPNILVGILFSRWKPKI